eukprot:3641548-Prymnesium_polylepis.2
MRPCVPRRLQTRDPSSTRAVQAGGDVGDMRSHRRVERGARLVLLALLLALTLGRLGADLL